METQIQDLLELSIFDGVLVVAIFSIGIWVFLTIGLNGMATGRPRLWSQAALAIPMWGGAFLLFASVPYTRTFVLAALLVCLIIVGIGGYSAMNRDERSRSD